MKVNQRLLACMVFLVPTFGLEASLETFFDGQAYDPSIPGVSDIVGVEIGERALRHTEIVQCLTTWDGISDRAIMRPHGHSHEGRSLNHLIISDPGNLASIDAIQAKMAMLSAADFSSKSEIVKEFENLPGVALYSYSIHGEECSGADSALLFIHHLLASQSEEIRGFLARNVIIVNPLQNPDGRDRYLKMIAEGRSDNANFDDQDLIPRGYWSRGRTNHYLFDLNRDWLFGIHPETQGLMAVVNEWNPIMVVDAHEMYPQDTYLFSPPIEPINPNRPKWLMEMGHRFSREQAAAFDKQGWLYFTGEWDEEWYPGYTSSWSALRGAIPILYEQGRVSEGAIAHANGTKTAYRETVEHHFLSSLTSLRSMDAHRDEIKGSFLQQRLDSISKKGPLAKRAYVFPRTANTARIQRLMHTFKVQGIQAYTNTSKVKMSGLIDRLGKQLNELEVPEGAIIVPCRQPLANLVSAMLQFDPAFPEGPARREREKLLREGDSNIYDITAWNLGMFFDLETYECSEFDGDLSAFELIEHREFSSHPALPDAYAYIVDGADDSSVVFAAQLMEAGVEVRISDDPAEFNGRTYSRGSVVVTARDNRASDGYRQKVEEIARTVGVHVEPLQTGKATSESTDLGGDHYVLLEKPRVALLTRGNNSLYSTGNAWYLLDKTLSINHSLLNEENIASGWDMDLRRYNVIILPERRGGLPKGLKDQLDAWVEQGGTLIAMGRTVSALTDLKDGLAETRHYVDALEELDDYELDVQRAFQAEFGVFPDYADLLATTIPSEIAYPSSVLGKAKRASKEALEMKYKWQRLFAPSGALLAGRANEDHWLAFGVGEYVPILCGRDPLLVSKLPVETPVRMGVFVKAEQSKKTAMRKKESEDKEEAEAPRVGWVQLPEGYEMKLRMSGLLWPEAAEMLANSSYLTRESVGDGQVILFANNPAFRNSTLGTTRMLMNAIIYGPGMGTTPNIDVL